MNAIVVVDKEWGIGKNNDLLFHLKKDMAFFKKTTTGKVVAMGANTYLSLPRRPLKDRVNVVLDASGKKHEGAICFDDLGKMMQYLKSKYPADDVFIIGGASVYAATLPFCNAVYVTKVDAVGGAEVFYPNLDEMDEWKLTYQSKPEKDEGFDVTFNVYEKIK